MTLGWWDLGANFSSKYKTLLIWGLKICIGGGFERVYMNSLNLIYVVLIFLKLKIYSSKLNINLSLSKKIFFQKIWKIYQFFPVFLS